MHDKNMIRATRDCNLNFMIHFYPIIEHIKDFYKKFKEKGLFLEIIKDAIKKDNSIVKFGAPDELITDNEVGHFIGGYKYNL